MNKVVFVYDDREYPSREIAEINGGKSFGNTIYKRRTLQQIIEDLIPEKKAAFIKIEERGTPDFSFYQDQTSICHLFSSVAVKDIEAFQVLLEKAPYVKENYVVFMDGFPAMGLFPSVHSYESFLREGNGSIESLKFRMKDFSEIQSGAFLNLSIQKEFLNFITGGFEARFFNALEGDEYTVTKKSSNKEKIKSEYDFYYLLPDEMKRWFVMPFHYQNQEKFASYEMERYHMTDIAIRFVHGAIDIREFRDIMDQVFLFVQNREKRTVSSDEAAKHRKALYIEKVEARIAKLKQHEEYQLLENLIQTGTKYHSISEIVDKYEKLYNDITNPIRKMDSEQVIGHGDLCFSNILYQKDARILRLIDPKGAQMKEELYTDSYYDLAKLSHSICGRYDFFNSGLYDIRMDETLQFYLKFDDDRTEYQTIFREYLENAGFNYRVVRILEASLFLSMLPLHMDRPKKVLGFLLNAINIMEEV